jgi:hypothetical protein
MSDIFGHSHGLNIYPLRPGQDCTTLCDYLESLSAAQQVLSFDRRQLQLHKTAETAIPKLTQMVQSPPHTFWYSFSTWISMLDIRSVENYWTTHNDANWLSTLVQYFFKVIWDNHGQTIWQFSSKIFLFKHVQLWTGRVCHVIYGSKSTWWFKEDSKSYQNWLVQLSKVDACCNSCFA